MSEQQAKELLTHIFRDIQGHLEVPEMRDVENVISRLLQQIRNRKEQKRLTYAEIKKLHGLTDTDFAEIYGLKNVNTYTSSSAFRRYKKATEALYYIFVLGCR